MPLNKLLRGMVFSVLAVPLLAHADVSISSPAVNTSVAACKDYFTSEWGHGLDMTNASTHGDILFNLVSAEFADLNGISYSNGLASMTTGGNTPFIRFLTPESAGQLCETNVTRYGCYKPIDPTVYNTLTFRMYSSLASSYSARWDKGPNAGVGITNLATTTAGWKTYQIRLDQASIGGTDKTWNNGANHGFALYPARNSLSNLLKLDWLQITPDSSQCSTFSASYNTPGSEVVSVFVDDNATPFDGFLTRTTPAILNGSTSTSFNSNLFYPGTYNIVGFSSSDYATHYLNKMDMADSTDIDTGRITNISNPTYNNGKFCGTVSAADPSFHLKLPQLYPIDAATFNKFSIGFEGGVGTIQVLFFDSNFNFVGARNVDTTGSGVYQINLAAAPSHPADAGTWTGQIGAVRIDPETGTNSNFCVSFISIGTSYTGSEPADPTIHSAGGTVTISPRYTAPIKQPDRFGGTDFFTSVLGNPANMNSTDDFDRAFNLGSGNIYPGKAYTDNGGATYTDSYLEASNTSGGGASDGDPQVFMTLRDTDHKIDTNRFRVACTKMTLQDKSIFADHTVLRFGWEVDPGNGVLEGYTSDDIVLRTVGQASYCYDLDGAAIEQGGQTVNGDFWQNDSGGTGIQSFRIDPYEIETVTPFRIADVRLASLHESNTQYAIVIGGDRDKAVTLYKNSSRSTTGGIMIGTLAANRTSDVFLWDTSGEADGSIYYIVSEIDGNRYVGEFPIKINRGFSDSTPPAMGIDAPASSGLGRYQSLNVAGYAVDNVRIATVEVLIDNALVTTFVPDSFILSISKAFATYPFGDQAGFNKSIDLSAFSDGPHTAKIISWDTAGNKTEYTTTFTKTSTNLTPTQDYGVPNEAAIPIDLTDPPTEGENLSFSVALSGNTLTYSVSGLTNAGGVNNCDQLRIKLADSATKVVQGPFTTALNTTLTGALSSLTATTAGLPKLAAKLPVCNQKDKKKKKKCQQSNAEKVTVYFQADCGDGTAISTNIKKVDASKVKSSTKVKTKALWMDKVRTTGATVQ